jgi:hypothetical protein
MTTDDRMRAFTVTVQTRGESSLTVPILSTLGHCDRYLRFVRIVVDRYEAANAAYVDHAERFKAMMKEAAGGTGGSSSKRLTEEESKEFLAKWTLGETLYLEVESFYLFAKILLDRVADVVCLYFGHPKVKDGSSHTRLKNGIFNHICRKNSMDGQVLVPRLEDLHRRVVRHKTDVVEHLANPRWFPGIGFGGDHRVTVSMGLTAPSEGETEFDTRETEDPATLLKEIEDYVVVVIDFLEANIHRSVLVSRAVDQYGSKTK